MDTTDVNIEFYADGTCNHCNDFLSIMGKLPKGKDKEIARKTLIEKIKHSGKGKKYDCIVGVSGGTDSSYVAYLAKKVGLRPLAVHLDNGWDSELAVNNIHNILKKLNINLETIVLDWEEFKQIQIAFIKSMTPDLDMPADHAIRVAQLRMAKKYGIKYILNGRNSSTEGILPVDWSYGPWDYKYLKTLCKMFGMKKIKTFPKMNLFQYLVNIFIFKQQDVKFLNYFEYNKFDAEELLKNELGWRSYGGKHYESVWTRFFQGYILATKFNFDKRKAHLSILVLNGKITREDALKSLEENEYLTSGQWKTDMDFVTKKLDFQEGYFLSYMNAENKTYEDYPNNAFFLQPHKSRIMKKLFLLSKKLGFFPDAA